MKPVAHKPEAASRSQLVLAGLIAFIVSICFAGKPVHQDDWAFLRVAERVNSNAGDLLAETTVYQGMSISVASGMPHGPLWTQALAVCLRFGDSGLWLAHLLTALCFCVLGVSIASLSGRLGAPPLATALMVVLSPVPMVLAGNVMTDVPMIAFFAASLALGARGLERGSMASLVGSGLFGAAAALTRYHGLAILPMLVALVVVWPRGRLASKWRERPLWLGLLPFAIGTGVVGLYLAKTLVLDGQADASRAVESLGDYREIDRTACLLAALAALGGTMLGPFLGWLVFPLRFDRCFGERGAFVCLFGGTLLGGVASLVAETSDWLQPVGANLWLQRVLLCLAGFGLLMMVRVVWRGHGLKPEQDLDTGGFTSWRERHGREALIAIWLIGYLVAAWVTLPFGSSRYALPALPAMVILTSLFAVRSLGARFVWAGILPTAVLGLGAAVADLHAAQVYPEFAEMLAERQGQASVEQPAQIWIWGELDFRWYLEESPGLANAQVLERASNEPKAGDLIFHSGICTASSDGLSGVYRLNPALVRRLSLDGYDRFNDAWPVRVHNSNVAAGFYGSDGGILPFALASAARPEALAGGPTVPHDRIATYRIADSNYFLGSFPKATIESKITDSLAGGNTRVEPFLVSHGFELGIAKKTAVSIIYPGRVTWSNVSINADVEALDLVVAQHDRTGFMPGPGAIVRVLVNGEVAHELVLDVRRDRSQRAWVPITIDMQAWAGQSVAITFEAIEGPWPGKSAESKDPSLIGKPVAVSVGFADAALR